MFHNIPGKYPLLRAHVWGRTGGKRGRNAPTALYTRSEAGGSGAPQSPLPAAVRPMVPPQPGPGGSQASPDPPPGGLCGGPLRAVRGPVGGGFPPKMVAAGRAGLDAPLRRHSPAGGREAARCAAAPPRPPAARRRDQRSPDRRGAGSAPHAARLRWPPSSPGGGMPIRDAPARLPSQRARSPRPPKPRRSPAQPRRNPSEPRSSPEPPAAAGMPLAARPGGRSPAGLQPPRPAGSECAASLAVYF